MSEKALRYFASKPGSSMGYKPLMAFPIIAIDRVERITHNFKLKKNDEKGHILSENAFEIFLKDDFLDIFLRSDYENLFSVDSNRRSHQLMAIQKSIRSSPSKKNLKERFLLEEHN